MTTPRTSNHAYWLRGKDISKVKCSDGDNPKIWRLRKSPVNEAHITETSALVEKFLWTSSKANIIPASGALNAADNPAAAPQVNKKRSSVLIRLKNFETAFPIIAPNWILGPSRPNERPPTIHNVPAIIFANKTLYQHWSICPWTSASTCGIPDPEMYGSYFKNAAITSPKITNPINHSIVNIKFPLTNETIVK